MARWKKSNSPKPLPGSVKARSAGPAVMDGFSHLIGSSIFKAPPSPTTAPIVNSIIEQIDANDAVESSTEVQQHVAPGMSSASSGGDGAVGKKSYRYNKIETAIQGMYICMYLC